MVSGLILNSLVCLAIAGGPAEVSSESRDRDAGKMPSLQPSTADGAQQRPDAWGREVLTLVEASKVPLLVELGRSRLLHFPAGIRRSALSNADVSDVVQVGLKDVLVLGKSQGVTTFTVWPASPSAAPAVIVVRVERRPSRDK